MTAEQLASDMYDRIHLAEIEISYEDFELLVKEFVACDYTFLILS